VKFSRRIQNSIADFRGLPWDNSPSILKNEWSIGQLFQDILKKYVAKSDVAIGVEIFENWPQIVGDMFCKLCTPHRTTATGALVIKVQNSVVRQELFCQKEEILQCIHRTCPRSGIRDIVFSL
jgi:predicted nucleic acid-binding Zn ribbon protein